MVTIAHWLSGSSAAMRARRVGSSARRVVVGAAAFLALVACGSAPTIVIALDSAAVELLRGAEVQVQVTLTRQAGASADVTLAVTGLPANVTADFSPLTLSGGTLTSTLTLGAAAAAADGSYDLSVTGTGTGLADTAALSLEVISLSVTGRVVATFGIPAVGVAVGSQGDTAVTDNEGAFQLTGLSVPYDLSVWSLPGLWLHVFEGLTAPELYVSPGTFVVPTGTTRLVTVSGDLSGGVIPVGVDQVVLVCAEGLEGLILGCDTVAPTETSYAFLAGWVGGTQRTARLHALQFQSDGDGFPVSYQGYASTDTTLTDGVPVVVDLDLGAALATTTVSVAITASAPIAGTVASVQVGQNMAMRVMLTSSPATSHQVLMPVIGDATYTFSSAAGLPQFGWQADVTGPTAAVVVPGPPQLVSPPDLSVGVTASTDFVASNPTGGPITFVWVSDANDLSVAVTTTSATHTIPDYSAYGFEPQPGTGFGWYVVGHSGTGVEGGVHGIADYFSFVALASGGGSQGLIGEGTFAFGGESRQFTTAP